MEAELLDCPKDRGSKDHLDMGAEKESDKVVVDFVKLEPKEMEVFLHIQQLCILQNCYKSQCQILHIRMPL